MGWTSANSQRVNTLFYSRNDGLPICLDCIFLKKNIQPRVDECIADISFGISAYRNSCEKYQSKWVGQQRYEVTGKKEEEGMKVFKIKTGFGDYLNHCVVADNMAEAERIFNAKYWPTTIKSIDLYSEDVQIQKYDEQAKNGNPNVL